MTVLTRGATSHALLVNDRGIVHAVEGVESHLTIILLKWLNIHNTLPPATTAAAPTCHRQIPFRTHCNLFGRYQVYTSKPQTIPDTNAPTSLLSPLSASCHSCKLNEIIAPCPNISASYMEAHYWLNGHTKSTRDHEKLCQEVLGQPDFNTPDVVGLNFCKLDKKLANIAKSWDPICPLSEGWQHIPIRLEIPLLHGTHSSEWFFVQVPGFKVCKLTDVIYKQFVHNEPSMMHYKPYESYWLPPGSSSNKGTQLHNDIFTSPAMLRAHCNVQKLSIADKGCKQP
jgi:hypothetical protein